MSGQKRGLKLTFYFKNLKGGGGLKSILFSSALNKGGLKSIFFSQCLEKVGVYTVEPTDHPHIRPIKRIVLFPVLRPTQQQPRRL